MTEHHGNGEPGVHGDGEASNNSPAGGYASDVRCQKFIDEVNDLLEHPCDSDRRAAIFSAVQESPECFEAFGIEQEVRRLLKRCCCEPAPESLRSRIRLAISETVEEHHRSVSPDGSVTRVSHRVTRIHRVEGSDG